jgi:predicted O-methyltransferase YrrM
MQRMERLLHSPPAQAAIRVRNYFRNQLRERRLAATFLSGRRELRQLQAELRRKRLLDTLLDRTAEFETRVHGRTARGNVCHMGGDVNKSVFLYYICRALKPRVVVETGVCNGFSSAFLLAALRENGAGRLHSIDLPERAEREYVDGTFWEGKEGSVIPADAAPGWIVPPELTSDWNLVLGRSQEKLPPLLAELGRIDLFVHDSEHSYACMAFEFEAAFDHLRDGGVLASDDIDWNDAFDDFARRVGRRPVKLTRQFGVIRK